MAIYLNQVNLIGNAGGEPKVATLQDNTKVAQISLATSTGGYKKQDGTEVPKKTTWHRIVLWRNLADLVIGRVVKGTKLFVSGSIESRKWTDQQGVEHETMEITAKDVIFCERAQDAQQGAPQQYAPQPQQAYAQQPPQQQYQQPPVSNPQQQQYAQPQGQAYGNQGNAGIAPDLPF